MSEKPGFADCIFEDSLEPFVEILSVFVRYGFDGWGWDAIRYGVKDTDVEADRWYEYDLIGERI